MLTRDAATKAPVSPDAVRLPAVAGTFYDADPGVLGAQLDRFLAEAPRSRGTGFPKAVVVPHAGYIYSGRVAAAAFVELAPFKDQIKRVVLVGPAHRVRVVGLVSPGASRLRTPLGDVVVDTRALDAAAIEHHPQAHAREHSLEVELPFLQKVVPSAAVVPLLVGHAPPSQVARVLVSLWGGAETVIVVSSDLSHYLPYGLAAEVDAESARHVLELDPVLGSDDACGAAAINGLLVAARERGLEPELSNLRSSGDTAGTQREVVGYGAFVFRERDP